MIRIDYSSIIPLKIHFDSLLEYTTKEELKFYLYYHSSRLASLLEMKEIEYESFQNREAVRIKLTYDLESKDILIANHTGFIPVLEKKDITLAFWFQFLRDDFTHPIRSDRILYNDLTDEVDLLEDSIEAFYEYRKKLISKQN